MQLAKEYYAWESYFLTKMLPNSRSKWLANHPVRFDEPMNVLFPEFFELFKKAFKQRVSAIDNASVQIRANKYTLVISINHPIMDSITGHGRIPLSLQNRWDELTGLSDYPMRRAARFTNTHNTYSNTNRSYLNRLQIPYLEYRNKFVIKINFDFILAPPGYYRAPSREYKNYPKLLHGYSFVGLILRVEQLLKAFDILLLELEELFAEDLKDIIAARDARITTPVDIQSVSNFAFVADLIKLRQSTPL